MPHHPLDSRHVIYPQLRRLISTGGNVMKTPGFIVCLTLPLSFLGCMNSETVTGSVPPEEPLQAGITLVSQSGNLDPYLQMTKPPAQPAGQTTGTWETTTDSIGYSTRFITPHGEGSALYSSMLLADESSGSSTKFVFSSSGAISDYMIPEPSQQAAAGLLTAGEWNDHLHWGDFRKFIRQYPDIGEHTVETLNEIIVRTIYEEVRRGQG